MPLPCWLSMPPPLMALLTLTVSLRLKVRIELLVRGPAPSEPLVPPLPTAPAETAPVQVRDLELVPPPPETINASLNGSLVSSVKLEVLPAGTLRVGVKPSAIGELEVSSV